MKLLFRDTLHCSLIEVLPLTSTSNVLCLVPSPTVGGKALGEVMDSGQLQPWGTFVMLQSSLPHFALLGKNK